MIQNSAPIPSTQIEQYRHDGWTLLPAVLAAAQIDLLRGGCQQAIAKVHAEMDSAGTDTIGINHRGKRYFCIHPSQTEPALYDFIYSPLMAGICRALLGPQVHVFWEQYVVKAGEGGHAFAWHQDSAYVEDLHDPYLTCWVALDDMSEANGSIYVLPHQRSPGRGRRVPHRHVPKLNDLIGYEGDDPGDLVVCPAGSIALFSSVTLHRSGVNLTSRARRVYLIQYSSTIIRKANGDPWGRSECFLRDGAIIAERPRHPAP